MKGFGKSETGLTEDRGGTDGKLEINRASAAKQKSDTFLQKDSGQSDRGESLKVEKREERGEGGKRRRENERWMRERREGPRVHNPLTDSFVE